MQGLRPTWWILLVLTVPFSFAEFLTIEDHEHDALWKDLVIAPFVEQLKTLLESLTEKSH